MALNINGRICLYFSVIWGFLGLALIKFINPLFDKFLDYIKNKFDIRILKASVLLVVSFLAFDAGITTVALKSFYAKLANDFNLSYQNSNYYNIANNNELFSEKHMLLIYPNLQIAGTKYNNTSVASLYKLDKNYYIQVFSSSN